MSVFRFKQFSIRQTDNAMKVGTDAMVLGALVRPEGKQLGLDIGAGTGVLSLMVAQRNTEISIDALELDVSSSKECAVNFENSDWSNRLNALNGDFLEFDFSKQYDFIVSNPPYFQSRLENNDERKAAARHESYLPLEPMVDRVAQLLSDEGDFWAIFPAEVQEEWSKVCNAAGLYATHITRIHGKDGLPANRIVCCYAKTKRASALNHLTIRDQSGKYTEAYIELTREFHFNDLRG